MSSHLPRNHRQNGAIALLPAMLIALLVTSLMSILFYTHQMRINRGIQQLHGNQAVLLTLSAESLARELLQRDALTSEFDHLGEIWAQPLPPVPVESGEMFACISDAQAGLNLNNFSEYTPQRWQQERFSDSGGYLSIWERLRESALAANPEQLNGDRLSAAKLIDYFDQDAERIAPEGGEDELYQSLSPQRRAANRPASQLTELVQVAGFNSRDIQQLQAYLTALPEPTSINVNTAIESMLTLLSDEIDPAAARLIAVSRPFRDTADFYQAASEVTGTSITELSRQIPGELLTTESSYFDLDAVIQLDSTRLHLNSLLLRSSSNDIRVIRRTLTSIPGLESEVIATLMPCQAPTFDRGALV